MNILIIGPNGSGKGTQGALIQKFFGLAHIESGGLFREHVTLKTDLGIQAKAYLDAGKLAPDTLTIPMVLETLKKQKAQGWLLDGFPRNITQAQQLYTMLQAQGIPLHYIVEIILPRSIAKNRIMGRRICKEDASHPNNIFIEGIKPHNNLCQVCNGALFAREDDQNEQAIDTRHDIYYNTETGTLAAVNYLKSTAVDIMGYISIDGQDSIDSINKSLIPQLGLTP